MISLALLFSWMLGVGAQQFSCTWPAESSELVDTLVIWMDVPVRTPHQSGI